MPPTELALLLDPNTSPTTLERIITSGDECASDSCTNPTGEQATYIPCAHCNKRFHIHCVNFTIQRAHDEIFACQDCERQTAT